MELPGIGGQCPNQGGNKLPRFLGQDHIDGCKLGQKRDFMAKGLKGGELFPCQEFRTQKMGRRGRLPLRKHLRQPVRLGHLAFDNGGKIGEIGGEKRFLFADKTVGNHPDLPDEKGKTFG
jgi:hypothetical protein